MDPENLTEGLWVGLLAVVFANIFAWIMGVFHVDLPFITRFWVCFGGVGGLMFIISEGVEMALARVADKYTFDQHECEKDA